MHKRQYLFIIGILLVLTSLTNCTSTQSPMLSETVNLEKPIIFDISATDTSKLVYIPGMVGTSPAGEEIKVNNRYLEMNGKPWLPSYGEFQFSRYPQEQWEIESD